MATTEDKESHCAVVVQVSDGEIKRQATGSSVPPNSLRGHRKSVFGFSTRGGHIVNINAVSRIGSGDERGERGSRSKEREGGEGVSEGGEWKAYGQWNAVLL